MAEACLFPPSYAGPTADYVANLPSFNENNTICSNCGSKKYCQNFSMFCEDCRIELTHKSDEWSKLPASLPSTWSALPKKNADLYDNVQWRRPLQVECTLEHVVAAGYRWGVPNNLYVVPSAPQVSNEDWDHAFNAMGLLSQVSYGNQSHNIHGVAGSVDIRFT
jgi:hypothetical protein